MDEKISLSSIKCTKSQKPARTFRRVHERAGRRDHAIAAYTSASTLVGAADETQRLAARALTRLKRR